MVGKSSLADMASLCVAVLVCSKAESLPLFHWNTLALINFKRYCIAVYHCFLNATPSRYGASSFTVTEKGGVGNGGVRSIKADELGKDLYENFKLLASSKIEQQAVVSSQNIASALRSHPLYFHPTTEDLALGRAQRRENII